MHYVGNYSYIDISRMPVQERFWLLKRLKKQKETEEKISRAAQGFQEVRQTKYPIK